MKSNSSVEHLIFFGFCIFEVAFIISIPAESSVAIISGLHFRE